MSVSNVVYRMGASAAAVWPSIADALAHLKVLLHAANEAARRNNDVVPDDMSQSFVEHFQDFCKFFGLVIEDAEEPAKKVIGLRVQQELLPYILLTEAGERYLTKPRGFPGDYWTIELVYRNRPHGTSRLGVMLDRCFLECPPGEAVRNRRKLISDEIRKAVASRPRDNAFVTSLACGPAHEAFDTLDELGMMSPIRLTLVDFDPQALAFVAARRDRYGLQEVVSVVEENLIRIATGRTPTPIRAQDLVYSVGLVDYFDDPLAIRLINLAYEMVRPGGRVVLGNFHPRNPWKAIMDHVLDWRLHHRTELDMDRLFLRSRFGRPCTVIRYEAQRINLFAECVRSND